MQSTGSIRFRPDGARFLTFHTADVPVRARMCAACGLIRIVGDPKKLRLLREIRTGDNTVAPR